MSRDPIVPPIAAVAVAIFAVSGGAILVRLSDAPSAVAAFYRVLFTTLPLVPIAAFRYRAAFSRVSTRDLGFAIVSGIALAIHFAAWFESLEWTSVAASVTLVQSQPLFVAVGAYLFLAERLTRQMVAGILVAVVGMATMSVGDLLSAATLVGADPLFGNLLAIVGAVMAGVYVLAGRSLRQRLALVPYVTIVYAVCTVVLLGISVGQGHALTGYPPREWAIFAALAIGPGLLGHTVLNWALGHLESSVVSVSLLGEPIGASALAVLVFAEFPTPSTIAGGAIVLIGIVLTARDRSAESRVDEPTPSD